MSSKFNSCATKLDTSMTLYISQIHLYLYTIVSLPNIYSLCTYICVVSITWCIYTLSSHLQSENVAKREWCGCDVISNSDLVGRKLCPVCNDVNDDDDDGDYNDDDDDDHQKERELLSISSPFCRLHEISTHVHTKLNSISTICLCIGFSIYFPVSGAKTTTVWLALTCFDGIMAKLSIKYILINWWVIFFILKMAMKKKN